MKKKLGEAHVMFNRCVIQESIWQYFNQNATNSKIVCESYRDTQFLICYSVLCLIRYKADEEDIILQHLVDLDYMSTGIFTKRHVNKGTTQYKCERYIWYKNFHERRPVKQKYACKHFLKLRFHYIYPVLSRSGKPRGNKIGPKNTRANCCGAYVSFQ